MIRSFLAFAMVCSVCAAVEPKPVLVVGEQNPWLMVVGSDSPIFALYDDGTIIYLRDKPSPEVPFYTRSVKDVGKVVAELLPFDMRKVQEYYELSSATDQASTMIWTPSKRIVIYGDWRKSHIFGSFIDRHKGKVESLPDEIRLSLRRIEDQRELKGTAWLPAKVEVMFWPYEYAPDESVRWPESWPGLNAKDTKMRGEGSYSVYLPSTNLAELRRLLATRKEKSAVLIDGQKMAESHRFPFPGESEWMRAHKEGANPPEVTPGAVTPPSGQGARQP